MKKQLQRNRSRLAIIKSAESSRIIISHNVGVVKHAYLDRKIPYYRVLAMLHPTLKSCIPTDLDITQPLHYYDFEESSIIPIEVSNVTMQIVSVPLNDFYVKCSQFLSQI